MVSTFFLYQFHFRIFLIFCFIIGKFSRYFCFLYCFIDSFLYLLLTTCFSFLDPHYFLFLALKPLFCLPNNHLFECTCNGILGTGTAVNFHKVLFRSRHQRCSIEKGVLRNFVKLTGKHLLQRKHLPLAGLRPAILLKKRLSHRCFTVNFAKFLRTIFLQNTSKRLVLALESTRSPGIIINRFY